MWSFLTSSTIKSTNHSVDNTYESNVRKRFNVRSRVESNYNFDRFLRQVESMANGTELKTMSDEDKNTIKDKVTEYRSWLESNGYEDAEVIDKKYDEFNTFYKSYTMKMYSQASPGNPMPNSEPNVDLD